MYQIPKDILIFQDFLLSGVRNNPGLAMTPKGITIHATANTRTGANARAHAKYIKGPAAQARGASWHFSVDDREIWQHLPATKNAWHAGDGRGGTGNRSTIGVEMCVNRDGNLNRTEANTIWLVVKLILEIPSIDAFLDRSIRQHWHWNRSNCPSTLRGRLNGWNDFTTAIAQQLKRESINRDIIDQSLLDRIASLENTVGRLQHDITAAMTDIEAFKITLAGDDLQLQG